MSPADPIVPDTIRTLAAFADLPLSPGREAAVTPVLRAWLADANALSRKMSASEYCALTPVTIFSHPPTEDSEGI